MRNDGVEFWLCDACANTRLPMRGFGTFASSFHRGRAPTGACPYCKTTEDDVRRTGLAGCPLCYEALSEPFWKEFGLVKWGPSNLQKSTPVYFRVIPRICTLALSLALALAGCGGSGGSSSSVDTQAHVRFFNSSPDTTALIFGMGPTNGADIDTTALPYLASTPSFANFAADDYDVIATEAATGSQALSDIVYAFTAGSTNAVVSVGLENFGSEYEKRLAVMLVPTELSAPNGNKARLIVVAGFVRATGYQTPGIDFEDVEASGTPDYVLSNMAFGSSQTELINAGSYSFEVKRNGAAQIYAEDASPTNFLVGKTYLVLITGIEGATGAQAPQIKYIQLN